MSRKRKMPSQEDIFVYWNEGDGASLFERLGIEVADHGCFACGFHLKIERCHINSVEHGGSDSLSNLHLLCPNCHIESEFLNEKFYWRWLAHQNENAFKLSIVRQYERMRALGIDEAHIAELVKNEQYREAAEYGTQHLTSYSEESREENISRLIAAYKNGSKYL